MASASNLKTPPVLVDEAHYTEWISDMAVWEAYTDIDKTKRGPAVYLTLSGKVRDSVRELTVEQLGTETGVQKIIEKLDKVFLKEENTRAYLAFKEFYDYRRPSGVTITDFLVKFEYLYHKLGIHNVKLPEGVRAFFLLTCANVSEE